MKPYLCALLLILFAAGCKKEQTVEQNDIKGTWQFYKYLLHNVDETQQFQNLYSDYTITFNGAGSFTEFYHNSVDTTNNQGTYYFTNYYNTLVLDQTLIDTAGGTANDTVYERQYTIFNLSGSAVELENDTSQLYLVKEM